MGTHLSLGRSRSLRWRHMWATLALERGIHPRVVQERLGHSTIAITLGIYSHVAPTLHDEAAELVASLVLE
jgi:integrase